MVQLDCDKYMCVAICALSPSTKQRVQYSLLLLPPKNTLSTLAPYSADSTLYAYIHVYTCMSVVELQVSHKCLSAILCVCLKLPDKVFLLCLSGLSWEFSVIKKS